MKGLSTFAVAVGLLSNCIKGVALQKKTTGPARVVGFPIQRKDVPDPVRRDKLRKRGTVQTTLDNEQTLYFANATLGTPAQSQRLHIDTGSSDLWVNTPKSKLCKEKSKPCYFAGSYDANSSSTYSYIGSYFNISYVDGSGSAGDYVTDTFTIGSTSLKQLQFGIGYTSSSSEGILGLGYEINEVQVGRARLNSYKNLPTRLVAEGATSSAAFSLWLNDLDANTGSILFGGVDTDQFEGELATLPIQTESGVHAEFLVTLTGLALNGAVIAANQAQAVLLDSGSSLTYLPDDIAQAIFQKVGAQYDASQATAFVPCSLASNSSTLDFTFSSPTIKVPMNELVLKVSSSSGRPLTFSDGSQACVFGIAPAGSSSAVLGDTFIRSAYLVYDLDNNEISIAQTTFNATTNNILEIGTAVPSATVVAHAVSATAGADANFVTGGATIGLGSTATSKSPAQKTKAPVGLGAVAALGLGIYAAI